MRKGVRVSLFAVLLFVLAVSALMPGEKVGRIRLTNKLLRNSQAPGTRVRGIAYCDIFSVMAYVFTCLCAFNVATYGSHHEMAVESGHSRKQ